ncbi:GNAT family N-acetyltransferase [Paenibacillus sp. GCM10027629]
MEIISYQEVFHSSLFEMIRSHIRQVPPFIDLKYEEFLHILHQPGHMTDQWYGVAEQDLKTFMVLKEGELIAAAQVSFPLSSGEEQQNTSDKEQQNTKENTAELLWIVGDSKFMDELKAFYRHLNQIVLENGCQSIHISRNPFGAGWAGIPDCWPHLLEVVQSVCSYEVDLWECYWSDGPLNRRALPIGYNVELTNNLQALQLHFELILDDHTIGEIDVWTPSTIASSLTEIGYAAMEWIEVSEEHRGQGIGHAMLSCMYDRCLELGLKRFILWTDTPEMKSLAIKSGFREGPVFHWITTQIEGSIHLTAEVQND